MSCGAYNVTEVVSVLTVLLVGSWGGRVFGGRVLQVDGSRSGEGRSWVGLIDIEVARFEVFLGCGCVGDGGGWIGVGRCVGPRDYF